MPQDIFRIRKGRKGSKEKKPQVSLPWGYRIKCANITTNPTHVDDTAPEYSAFTCISPVLYRRRTLGTIVLLDLPSRVGPTLAGLRPVGKQNELPRLDGPPDPTQPCPPEGTTQDRRQQQRGSPHLIGRLILLSPGGLDRAAWAHGFLYPGCLQRR
jgi:hypothetical protein